MPMQPSPMADTRSPLFPKSLNFMRMFVFQFLFITFFSCCVALSLHPQLPRVHDVLPNDVAARRYGYDWGEVGVGHPDGQDRIFLSEALPTADIIVTMFAHQFPDTELPSTHH